MTSFKNNRGFLGRHRNATSLPQLNPRKKEDHKSSIKKCTRIYYGGKSEERLKENNIRAHKVTSMKTIIYRSLRGYSISGNYIM